MNNNKTLGILGGGQLGRMSAMAAARLGIKTVIFCPEENSPASQIASRTIIADYSNNDALDEFSRLSDFISFEFENIPIETIDYLNSIRENPVLPGKKLLEVSQDRLKEKAFLNSLNIKTARWEQIKTIEDIEETIEKWRSGAFVIKTARMGYDGKGQIFCSKQNIRQNNELLSFLEKNSQKDLIIEDAINFIDEISVIIVRDFQSKTVSYGPMLNKHNNHILHKTIFPTPHNKEICFNAVQIGKKIAQSIELTGVLTVEFFVTYDGRLLANEIAPRTHNSGHWTIDACAVSQFEQHVRTVCKLPAGSAENHSNATMINLIGNDVLDADTYLDKQNACLHLYGKHDIREGRKMGHVTFLEDKNIKAKT